MMGDEVKHGSAISQAEIELLHQMMDALREKEVVALTEAVHALTARLDRGAGGA